jgi:hypothetical protein
MDHHNHSSIVYIIYEKGNVLAIFDNHEDALDMLCEDMLLHTAIVPDFRRAHLASASASALASASAASSRFYAVMQDVEADADAESENPTSSETVIALHSTYEGARDSEYMGEFGHVVEFAV